MNESVVDGFGMERDALCELMNVGGGNALTSLHRLVGGSTIFPSTPELLLEGWARWLDGLSEEGVLVQLQVGGGVEAVFVALFERFSAQCLVGALLGRDPTDAAVVADREGALLEAINIISCSFLGALAAMTGMTLVPNPPRRRQGVLAELVRDVRGGAELGLTTRFASRAHGFSGHIALLMDRPTSQKVIRALKKAS